MRHISRREKGGGRGPGPPGSSSRVRRRASESITNEEGRRQQRVCALPNVWRAEKSESWDLAWLAARRLAQPPRAPPAARRRRRRRARKSPRRSQEIALLQRPPAWIGCCGGPAAVLPSAGDMLGPGASLTSALTFYSLAFSGPSAIHSLARRPRYLKTSFSPPAHPNNTC